MRMLSVHKTQKGTEFVQEQCRHRKVRITLSDAVHGIVRKKKTERKKKRINTDS